MKIMVAGTLILARKPESLKGDMDGATPPGSSSAFLAIGECMRVLPSERRKTAINSALELEAVG